MDALDKRTSRTSMVGIPWYNSENSTCFMSRLLKDIVSLMRRIADRNSLWAVDQLKCFADSNTLPAFPKLGMRPWHVLVISVVQRTVRRPFISFQKWRSRPVEWHTKPENLQTPPAAQHLLTTPIHCQLSAIAWDTSSRQ